MSSQNTDPNELAYWKEHSCPTPVEGPVAKWLNPYPKPEVSGMKYDNGKLPLDLLDPLALEGLAAVLQFGAKKYASHNWRGGISWSRLVAALMRHTFCILRGEYVDSESGLPHIDHVQCCAMFLSNMMKTRPDLDDLYKEKK